MLSGYFNCKNFSIMIFRNMSNKCVRIFTYFPNPRIWKALIAANLLDVELEVRGDKPNNLKNWLWDFNAKPLSELKKKLNIREISGKKGFSTKLYKTKKFLKTNPFGTVPVAFNQSGNIGISESNSILRLIARLAKSKKKIYGVDVFSMSRIDSFLDSFLVFGSLTQNYLLKLYSDKALTKQTIIEAENAFTTFFSGIEKSLEYNKTKYLVSNYITLADISFFCEYSQFLYYENKINLYKKSNYAIINDKYKNKYKLSKKLFLTLSSIKAFKTVSEDIFTKYKIIENIK